MTLQTLQSEKQQLSEDDQEMIKQRAKLELDVKDLEESLVEEGQAKVRYGRVSLVSGHYTGAEKDHCVLWW